MCFSGGCVPIFMKSGAKIEDDIVGWSQAGYDVMMQLRNYQDWHINISIPKHILGDYGTFCNQTVSGSLN